ADRDAMVAALDRSIAWYGKPSSRQFFPIEGITHERARASTVAMREAVARGDTSTLESTLREKFDLYTSVGWNGEGVVLFTGYFSPVFNASLTRTPQYRYPLYTRPPDLASDPATGAILGRRVGSGIAPYPVRREFERDPAALGLAGRELVYLQNPLDAFIVHVNGSA